MSVQQTVGSVVLAGEVAVDGTWQEVKLSPEGAVIISYETLLSNPQSLQSAISKAFGSDPACLGMVIIANLPVEFVRLRESLLKLANKFGNLPESVREKYADANSKWSFGWSHGKEIMNGKPDILKGSYYANPILDRPVTSADQRAKFPEYYGQNVWPEAFEKGVEGFEDAFKALGKFIFQIGRELAAACQPFGDELSIFGQLLSDCTPLEAGSHLVDQSVSLPDLISPKTTKARLLHYFPPAPGNILPSDGEPVDSWCGFHLDHSLLTGLCSAMYMCHEPSVDPFVCPAPSAASGLYIRTRGGELAKVSIPSDCLAFQTGEALELATDGKLRATPHCVRVGGGPGTEKVSRETFALFMQPETEQRIGREQTFGSFSKRVFEEHYGNVASA